MCWLFCLPPRCPAVALLVPFPSLTLVVIHLIGMVALGLSDTVHEEGTSLLHGLTVHMQREIINPPSRYVGLRHPGLAN